MLSSTPVTPCPPSPAAPPPNASHASCTNTFVERAHTGPGPTSPFCRGPPSHLRALATLPYTSSQSRLRGHLLRKLSVTGLRLPAPEAVTGTWIAVAHSRGPVHALATLLLACLPGQPPGTSKAGLCLILSSSWCQHRARTRQVRRLVAALQRVARVERCFPLGGWGPLGVGEGEKL